MLQYFGLLQGLHPTHGALLCFGRDPTKRLALAGAFTRCTLWAGSNQDSGWLEAQDYRLDLVTQFENSRNFLRKHLSLVREIGSNERKEEAEIPFIALEEALANALVHREYANQASPVYIDIFKDRIEISSPGLPPEPMTLELLQEEHKSHPRNPQIARIFYLCGYVEKVGSGIRRMQRALRNAGLHPAKFKFGKDKTFTVIFDRSITQEEASNLEEAFSSVQLRSIRRQRGWSQAELAEKVGINPKTVSRWERGMAVPSPYYRGKLSAILGQKTKESKTIVDNLPPSLTSLIGREKDVTSVKSILQRADVRLLTLTGPGGVGKTRLGREVAAQLRTTYTDGICFVSLAAISNHELVISSIAQTLGLKTLGSNMKLDPLKAFLHEKRLLLFLDNFEQVSAAAPMLSELLESCPEIKFLVTSRAALHIQGEHLFIVSPLKREASIALFVQRAQAIIPDFQITDSNTTIIADICSRLDDLPLALELAAARVKMFPPEMLLSRLEHSLRLLVGGGRDASWRQRTLSNTIQWSYNLLTPDEQLVFRRLSVFVGGCNLEAIEALCSSLGDIAISVLEEVNSLLDKSLLSIEHVGSKTRIQMLEIIQEYGLTLLEAAGELATTQKAHAMYCLNLADNAIQRFTSLEREEWLRQLALDYENLKVAHSWALTHGYEVEKIETVMLLIREKSEVGQKSL